MAAGLLPSRGMSPAFPPNGGKPGKIIDEKTCRVGWEYVSFEEGKWMIGTLEPSNFWEAKEPLRTDVSSLVFFSRFTPKNP